MHKIYESDIFGENVRFAFIDLKIVSVVRVMVQSESNKKQRGPMAATHSFSKDSTHSSFSAQSNFSRVCVSDLELYDEYTGVSGPNGGGGGRRPSTHNNVDRLRALGHC